MLSPNGLRQKTEKTLNDPPPFRQSKPANNQCFPYWSLHTKWSVSSTDATLYLFWSTVALFLSTSLRLMLQTYVWDLPRNKNITLGMHFQRLNIVGGSNSCVDEEVLMPFGQQGNGSMTSQYGAGGYKVVTEEKLQRGQYQTNRKQRFTSTVF